MPPVTRLCAVIAIVAAAAAPAASQQPAGLQSIDGHFALNGQPFQVISGEMHYARIPRELWRDRLRKARAMGLNTISTYVFWNLHEPAPGHFDFSGQNDVAEYIRIAQQEGLHVILRPGPYVCAEWELGGYPAWLLADSTMILRSTDPHFTAAASRWLDRLGRELSPLLASHGGPIIAVQVENEYGSFDHDTSYMAWQRDALRHAGFGSVRLYTADGDYQLRAGTLPDLPAVVNFGVGESDSAFARLARFRPGAPLMSGEYWAGWFDQWGGNHAHTDETRQVSELDTILSHGHSVNLYMFHGGTTFGFMNGANIDNGKYHPQTTSYDYDAALDESGRPTPKYYAFRDLIARYTKSPLSPFPVTDSTVAVAGFALAPMTSLWQMLPKPAHVDRPRSMETFGQSYGYILYRTTVPGPLEGELVIRDVRDYARIYVNGQLQATLDRRLNQDSAVLRLPAGDARLDILVENGGRVNFTKALRGERKGITKSVTLGGRELTGWDVYTLPMSSTPEPRASTGTTTGPAIYYGTFTTTKPGDTYLDMTGWGKGAVWVNGHALGRFWQIGPQLSLYLPGVWIRNGVNQVTVFDFDQPAANVIRGVEHAVWK
ncbi:MAG TPA: glycoside hydrolase family 35 protein [Gemmatimonadales bacterium]|jgi:beta-galactosidase